MLELIGKNRVVRRFCYAILFILLVFVLQPVLVVLAEKL